jgi:hypothetical protein
VWGKCIGCPKWRGCCTHISDPICVGANALCRTARGVANLALEAAKAAYRVVFLPFEAAKFALEVAKTGLRAAQTPFYVANRVLEAGKATVRVGLDIAASIARSVFGQIIDIRSIGFNADFRDFANLKVDAAANVILFGREYDFRFSFRLDTDGIVNTLLEELKPGVLKVLNIRKRRSLEVTEEAITIPSSPKEPEYTTSEDDFFMKSGRLADASDSAIVTEDLNQRAMERQQDRENTVNRLLEATASQNGYTNVLKRVNMRLAPRKFPQTIGTHNRQGTGY